jgi:ATP-dependent Clp protease ATP-binding subunit ClpA
LATVRARWDAVLQENLAAAQKAAEESGENFNASVAFDELRLQMIVNDLQRNEVAENDRQKHLNELRGLTRGGKKGDFLALQILQKEAEKGTRSDKNDLDFLKKNLHKRLENGEIDPVINELLALTQNKPPLQERLKNMKLALRK